MNSSQDIEDQIEKIKQAAEVVNAFVVLSPLVGVENGKVVKAFLDESEFLCGIEHIKPIALYLDVQRLEISDDIMEHSRRCRDDDDDDDVESFGRSFDETPQYRALIKKWSNREGAIMRFDAVFRVGMIHNTFTEVAGWIDAFHEDVEKGFAAYAETERERAEAARLAWREEVREKAKILSEHPLFGAPRSSKAKREYLAQQVFPKVKYDVLADILELADLLFWYRGSNPSPKT